MFQPEYEQRLLPLKLQQSPVVPVSASGQQFDDRFIPQRRDSNWESEYHLKKWSQIEQNAPDNGTNYASSSAYAGLLRNELLGSQISSVDAGKLSEHRRWETGDYRTPPSSRLFSFQPRVRPGRTPFSTISVASQRLLAMGVRPKRKVSKLPYKILDAPELQEDFYFNLIDWSSGNRLGVGLGYSVYLWSASNGQVSHLCDFSHEDNPVTSVVWNKQSDHLAVGTLNGLVSIWDATCQKVVANMEGHTERVCALSWRGPCLSSGSRDRTILNRDIRLPSPHITLNLRGHRQEVTGLRWSPTGKYLASGGNDSRVILWTQHSLEPVCVFKEHKAAVKALDWAPHKPALLATGGGTADRCLRFWNALNGQMVECIDTGAQISNLAWAPHSSELVTTHGHGQAQIILWAYPTLKQIVRLSAHSQRVVYLAVSPEGESIVTGAGDETLRFWKIFNKRKEQPPPFSALRLGTDFR